MVRLVLLMVALAAGGGAAWLALAMQGQPAVATIVQEMPRPAMQDVLVAAADLGPGQPLTKENVRWQPWPESALSPAYIGRSTRPDAVEAMVGSIVRTRMIGGEPIQEEKLVPHNGGFLSAMLPPGKRAVAVRISAENTAGGFILPNDRVDVISTSARQGQRDGQKEHVSRIILSNVRVLAIDQSIDEKAKDEKTKDEKSKSKAVIVGKTATLELEPVQVEIIAAGEATGMLSLALRSASDNGEVPRVVMRQPGSQAVLVIRGSRTQAVEK